MKKSTLRQLAAAATLTAASGGAMASDYCASVYSSLSWYLVSMPSSYPYYVNYYKSEYPSCFPGAAPAATNQTVVSTSFVQIGAITQNLGSRLLAGGPTRVVSAPGSGLAAGGTGGWNVWASYSGDTSSYRVNNLTVTGAPGSPFFIDNENEVNNLVAGADYRYSPSIVLGASAALDDGKGSARATAAAGRTATSARGQALAAYIGWQIDRNWALDATVGGGIGHSDPAPGTTVDSTRRFAGANLTYANWIGNWQLIGKGSYQFGAEEFKDARKGTTLPFTYYTARLGQFKVGGEAGYWLADGIMPYVGAAWVKDLSRNTVRVSQLWDEDSFNVSVGVNFFSVKNSLTGGIVYTDELNRKYVTHGNWMANINYRF